MSRDLVLATMALVLCGAGVWFASWMPAPGRDVDGSNVSGRRLERRAWRRMWLPLLPAAVVFATLVGWAAQEPAMTDERLRPIVALVAFPVGLLWLRGAVRAWRAARRPTVMPIAATFGLLRPTVVIAQELNELLDTDAMAAAIAHERAHARHRDPLRIWLAQIVSDVQWPSPAAEQRLRRWLASLEVARDEEARINGAPGAALAAAVVAVAKMTSRGRRASVAVGLTGSEASLSSRVERLLSPLPPDRDAWLIIVPLVVAVALAVAVAAGVAFGDSLLRALPFIVT